MVVPGISVFVLARFILINYELCKNAINQETSERVLCNTAILFILTNVGRNDCSALNNDGHVWG